MSIHVSPTALLPCLLACFTRFFGSVFVLRDLDRFLPLVVWIVGDVLDQGVDQCVLVQRLGADHHVGLAVPILTGHCISDLLLVWSYLHVCAWHSFPLPKIVKKSTNSQIGQKNHKIPKDNLITLVQLLSSGEEQQQLVKHSLRWN